MSCDASGPERNPTPEEIADICRRIRSGEIVVTAKSGCRWAEVRESERIQAELQAFDLGGRLVEDAVEVPAWFGEKSVWKSP